MRYLVIALDLVGAGCLVAGVALWSLPGALVCAGVLMLATATLVERRS